MSKNINGMPASIVSIIRPMFKGMPTNGSSSPVDLAPTTVEPVTIDGDTPVIEATGDHMKITAVGEGAAAATLATVLYGIVRVQGDNALGVPSSSWIKFLIGSYDWTLSNATGSDDGAIRANERVGTTVAAVGAVDETAQPRLWSPSDNTSPAYLILDTLGVDKVLVEVKPGTATAGNILATNF